MRTDRIEIQSLIHVYAERLDAGDLDGVAALFEHATWGSPNRAEPVRGAAAIRARNYDPVILYADGTPRTRHVLSNVSIEHERDATEASARTYFTVWQAVDDFPLQAILVGRYHDRFVKDGGTWRFEHRQVFPDLVGDLGHHMRGGPLESADR
jgi:hypothetical protein